jgi:hypothetical protein
VHESIDNKQRKNIKTGDFQSKTASSKKQLGILGDQRRELKEASKTQAPVDLDSDFDSEHSDHNLASARGSPNKVTHKQAPSSIENLLSYDSPNKSKKKMKHTNDAKRKSNPGRATGANSELVIQNQMASKGRRKTMAYQQQKVEQKNYLSEV